MVHSRPLQGMMTLLRVGSLRSCGLTKSKQDMIKVRGWQVAPAELEACLMQHPQVAEVAVIGIKSSIEESELPRAYVVLKQTSETSLEAMSTTEEDLKEFLGSRLASYKALDGGVKFVESLPKTVTGKVLKNVLRENSQNFKEAVESSS